jgi:uncharacterized UBP type Zn finger protein
MSASPGPCSHAAGLPDPPPRTPQGCEECMRMHDTWVHLRLCRECGHVGCCDDSKNTHATRHFHATKHPVMRSFQPGEHWSWCYIDDAFWES